MASIPFDSPYDSRLGKYYVQLKIGKYERPAPFTRATFNYEQILILPLPIQLRDNTSVGFSDKDLEAVGDVYNGASGGIEAAALRYSGDIIKGTIGGIAGSIGGMAQGYFASKPMLTGSLRGAFNALVQPDQITSAVQQDLGKAPNPNPSVMFTGPELREFGYSWTIYPKNKKDSEKLQKTIAILKRSALPENLSLNEAAVLKYPKMVLINYFPWDSDGIGNWGWSDNSIIKHKKCVMKSVNINYAPAGSPGFFHETNGPVAVNIDIMFKEIEYMLSNDWGGSEATVAFGDLSQEATNVRENNRKLPTPIPGATPGVFPF
jgi:hypothetical protein